MQEVISSPISANDRQFIIKALEEEHRIDGRRPYDYRKLQLQIGLDGTSVSLLLGHTLVLTTVSATIEQPAPERANEGVLRMNVEYSSMASPALDSTRSAEDYTDIQRLLEKSIRDLRVVDLEALCILPGRKVWRVQLDIRVVDAAGNLMDAVFLSALTALMAFKRPEVSVEAADDGTQSKVVVHSVEEREALPLSLHQAPIAITFGVFKDGDSVLVDPCMKEEAASAGSLTVVLNVHNEVCLLHKAGGVGLSLSQVMHLVRIAGVKVSELSEKLKAALEAHELARVAARVRRRAPHEAAAVTSSRIVAVLSSGDITGDAIREQVKQDLEALENAAAEETSSSEDEEKMEEEEGESRRDGGASSLHSEGNGAASVDGQPLGVGVLAPAREPDAGPLENDGELVEMDTEPPDASAAGEAGTKQDSSKPTEKTLHEPLDEYEQIAAAIAGPKMHPGLDLRAAVKKKARGKKGEVAKQIRRA